MTPAERRRAAAAKQPDERSEYGLVARAMTVQASRLYALLVFRAELDAERISLDREDRDAPGATQ